MTKRWPPDGQWISHARERTGFIEKVIPPHGVGAELGVYCGDFTAILLDVAQPTLLHLVDLWGLLGPSWEHWGIQGPTTNEALDGIRHRFSPQIDAGQVEVHEADDLLWLAGLDDHSLDWCYIDTAHTVEQCSAELPLAAAKVKPGGVICGDDWTSDPTHPHHGVFVAVHAFLDHNPYDLIYGEQEDGQWAIARR